LLGNAIKFTDDGEVTFRVSSDPISDQPKTVKIHLEVEDTGVGMTERQLEKIFLPFEQVGENQRLVEGTGLGLAISQKLTQMMDSEIQVKSQVGHGSTFWIDLELSIGQAKPDKAKTPRENIIGYEGPRRQVLVVDDKLHNRSVIANLFEQLGFETIEAENGLEGVEKARQLEPDVIVMDLVMPVMTGFEAAQKIRQIPTLQDILIIASSASVFDEDREQSRLAGCNTFLPKPIEVEKLLDILESYIGLKWVYQEAKSTTDEMGGKDMVGVEAEMVPPPPGELAMLYELTMRGDMQGIQKWAVHLEQADVKYRLFSNRLHKLAEEFEDEQILVLLEPFINMKE